MAGGVDVDVGRELWGVNHWLNSESGVKAFVKTGKDILSWLDFFEVIDKRHEEPYARTYQSLDTTKKILNGVEIPFKVEELAKKCHALVVEPSIDSGCDATAAVSNLWASVQDVLEEIFKGMSSEEAMFLEKVGGVMLTAGMSCLIRSDVKGITKKTKKLAEFIEARDQEKDKKRIRKLNWYITGLKAQRTNQMITVANWTVYLALGIMTIAFAIFAAPVTGVMFLAGSSTGIVLSIAKHFHNVHIVEPIFEAPKLENKNLDEVLVPGFTAQMLREYSTDDWNTRDANEPVVGGAAKLPNKAKERLQGDWRDPSVRKGLGWPEPDSEDMETIENATDSRVHDLMTGS